MQQWKYLGQYSSANTLSVIAIDNSIKDQVVSFSLALSSARFGEIREVVDVELKIDSANGIRVTGTKIVNKNYSDLLSTIYYQVTAYGILIGIRLDGYVFIKLRNPVRLIKAALSSPSPIVEAVWSKYTNEYHILVNEINGSLNWDAYFADNDTIQVDNDKENEFIVLDKSGSVSRVGIGTSPNARVTIDGLIDPMVTDLSNSGLLIGNTGSIGVFNGYPLIRCARSMIPIELDRLVSVISPWSGLVFYIPGFSLTTNFAIASTAINPDNAIHVIDTSFLYSKVASMDSKDQVHTVNPIRAEVYNYGFILYKTPGILSGVSSLFSWGSSTYVASTVEGGVELRANGSAVTLDTGFDSRKWLCVAFSFPAADEVGPLRLALSKYISGSLDTYSNNSGNTTGANINDVVGISYIPGTGSSYSHVALFGLFYGKEDSSNEELEYITRTVMKVFVEN